MPKAKSPKTLQKEAKWKELVTHYFDSYTKNDLSNKPAMDFSFVPGVVKSSYDDVHIRKARLNAMPAGFLRMLKAKIDAMPYAKPYFKSQVSYLAGSFINKHGNPSDATVAFPSMMIWKETSFKVNNYTFQAMRLSADPAKAANDAMFHDEAVMMTWPDEMGIVTIYMHRASKLCRKHFPKIAYKEGEGINRQALEQETDWAVLADFIDLKKELNMPIPQRTVCEIVKVISGNIAAKELKQMKSAIGA